MKPVTKKVLIVCALAAFAVFVFDVKKEKVTALFAPSPASSSANIEKAKSLRPEDRAWQLCWVKLPGLSGVDQTKREGCQNARVVRYGASFFDVEVFYEHQWRTYPALYQWNRAANPSHGVWNQPAPKGGGKWFLEKTGEGFVGWETHEDSSGKLIARKTIWLKPVK